MCVSGWAPSGRSASLMAFMTAPGAPAVPASPAPLAPSSESAVRVTPLAAFVLGTLAGPGPGEIPLFAFGRLPPRAFDHWSAHRPADPLHHAAANLLVDELRVDDRAAVLHAPVLEQLYDTGVGVDFEVARLHAVGEGERPGARHIVAGRHQLRLEARRQRVRTEIG